MKIHSLRRSQKVRKVAFAGFRKLFFIYFLIFRYDIFSIMIITVYKESIFSTFRSLIPLPEKENNSFFFVELKGRHFIEKDYFCEMLIRIYTNFVLRGNWVKMPKIWCIFKKDLQTAPHIIFYLHIFYYLET